MVFSAKAPKAVAVNQAELPKEKWRYAHRILPTFAQENSASDFSKEVLDQGMFIMIDLGEADLRGSQGIKICF